MRYANKVISVDEAIAHVRNGSRLMLGEFVGAGEPACCIEALLASGIGQLTLITNTPGLRGGFLKARLFSSGQLAEVIGTLTRQGLEEYVSDCVILLDHRVHNQISTRRMRIVKYRGTAHGTNEYPFLIDRDGFSVLPVSSLGLNHKVFDDRIPSGIADLDAMLSGGGFSRGSSILVSGVAGSGKSSLSASFVYAAAERGERAIYFSFEEAEAQIVRNVQSVRYSTSS